MISEEPVVQAVPFSFIAPQSVVAAPVTTAISHITPSLIEQRMIPSSVSQINPLSRSAHFGGPIIS